MRLDKISLGGVILSCSGNHGGTPGAHEGTYGWMPQRPLHRWQSFLLWVLACFFTTSSMSIAEPCADSDSFLDANSAVHDISNRQEAFEIYRGLCTPYLRVAFQAVHPVLAGPPTYWSLEGKDDNYRYKDAFLNLKRLIWLIRNCERKTYLHSLGDVSASRLLEIENKHFQEIISDLHSDIKIMDDGRKEWPWHEVTSFLKEIESFEIERIEGAGCGIVEMNKVSYCLSVAFIPGQTKRDILNSSLYSNCEKLRP